MLYTFLNTELDAIKNHVDKEVVEKALSKIHSKFESFENSILISFDWLSTKKKERILRNILIFFNKDDVIFICKTDDCYSFVKKIAKENASTEKIVYNFFNDLIKDDIDYLDDFEENITDLEDDILTGKIHDCSLKIVELRRELLELKRYYDQFSVIFDGIIENENMLIRKEFQRDFTLLDKRTDRIYAHVLTLRDYITQVRETYQAQIDIQQNNIMKIFTVMTAIFLPLTLIVGWYGMNFEGMPELSWKYGYPFVIGISVVVILICVGYFKGKKWFD